MVAGGDEPSHRGGGPVARCRQFERLAGAGVGDQAGPDRACAHGEVSGQVCGEVAPADQFARLAGEAEQAAEGNDDSGVGVGETSGVGRPQRGPGRVAGRVAGWVAGGVVGVIRGRWSTRCGATWGRVRGVAQRRAMTVQEQVEACLLYTSRCV